MQQLFNTPIDWYGPVLTLADGYGFHSRMIVSGLIKQNLLNKAVPMEPNLGHSIRCTEGPVFDAVTNTNPSTPDADTRVNFCIPPIYRKLAAGTTIGYSVWETSQYPREWIPAINNVCNKFLAPSKACKKTAIDSGVSVPVDVMYPYIDDSIFGVDGKRTWVNSDISAVKFLFVGNWIPRKNYEDLLTAFRVAFDNVKDVQLVIKTWCNTSALEGRQNIENAVRHLSGKVTGISKTNIQLITDVMSDDQVGALIRGCDIYVSCSKGESLDVPMMLAMNMQKIVVSDTFLGHGDYILPDVNAVSYNYSLDPVVGAAAPCYDSYQMWARPNMDSLIESFRRAYKLFKEGNTGLGIEARKMIQSIV